MAEAVPGPSPAPTIPQLPLLFPTVCSSRRLQAVVAPHRLDPLTTPGPRGLPIRETIKCRFALNSSAYCSVCSLQVGVRRSQTFPSAGRLPTPYTDFRSRFFPSLSLSSQFRNDSLPEPRRRLSIVRCSRPSMAFSVAFDRLSAAFDFLFIAGASAKGPSQKGWK